MNSQIHRLKNSQIICYGSLNIDYVYQVEEIASPGETINSKSLEIFPGGKGANQALAAARAGGHVHHAGKIGHDGEWMLSGLQKDQIDTSNVVISDGVTGHAVIQVDSSGENTIVLFGGANQNITKQEIEKTLSKFDQDSILMIQNETSEITHILNTAIERGMFVCLNPSPISNTIQTLDISRIGLLVVNEIEAQALGGDSGNQMQNLKNKCPSAIIVKTQGSQGGVVSLPDSEEIITYQARDVVAVDTTAAGDTFLGYLVAGLSNGSGISEAINTACRAAEHCVTVQGAQSSIPHRKQLD
ncbi:Ribokinase [Synechococcus sp. MIT S9509]|uniref:ribokinase n=1 Tax=Synechococcus sp. MIT S9509 TaxID=1801630 RepID=UPI0007BB8496|nr:ribokinase [Synechococcus sp. MIT S9509]KZR91922.1 Ribokinase [Synechococcus sp. MIT S9509]